MHVFYVPFYLQDESVLLLFILIFKDKIIRKMVKFRTQLFTVSDILWVIFSGVKAEKENNESNDDLFVRLLFEPSYS